MTPRTHQRIVEVLTIAALASYARQAKDDQLRKLADRIQARAIRRCGELLKQIEPGNGARDGKRRDGDGPPLNRTTAAESAGISERQRKTALRVASVPYDDFERQVESFVTAPLRSRKPPPMLAYPSARR